MKEIPLTQGKVALVDDQDYEALAQYKWCAQKSAHTWYADRHVLVGNGKYVVVRMHRVILGAPPGQEVDHVDGDGLHNWRENLRHCTRQQNQANMRRRMTGWSSQYKGVCWNDHCGKWEAGIKVNYKRVYLGVFNLEADAARAYNAAALEHWGEFACLNEIEE